MTEFRSLNHSPGKRVLNNFFEDDLFEISEGCSTESCNSQA